VSGGGGSRRLAPADLAEPIVLAPLAGGPSTPQLAASVSGAGGLGFLGAGYKAPDAVRADIAALRELTDAPFGLNLFAPPSAAGDAAAVARYARSLAAEGALGDPRHDDDAWEAKLALAIEERVPVMSFTFGCPEAIVIAALKDAGIATWVTVTTPDEAVAAAAAGADALVVQGLEAGGHRGSFDDAAPGTIGLLVLLQLVAAAVDLPLVATGGLMTGRAIAAALVAGADAAALGTAFLLTPEAGTSPAHRQALRAGADTTLTRAFTGRTARGLVNRFLREHDADAPSAYPELHHLTAPLRAAARERGDAEAINLWAGQGHPLATEEPAAELVRRLADEVRRVLAGRGDRPIATGL
jgi:nitronate monooxygenase